MEVKFLYNDLVSDVNHESNILFLCPNCHWAFDHGLLEQSGLGFIECEQKDRCILCKQELNRVRVINARLNVRPTKDQLIEDLCTLKYINTISKKYKVSGNSVRKWCRLYELPSKKDDIVKFITKEPPVEVESTLHPE